MRYKLTQTGPEVQAAINKIIDLQEATPSKAGLLSASDKDKLDNVFNSPELVGTPTAPTAPQGTSTTQIATTEFVQNEVSQLHQFSYQVVAELPVASADTMYIIYFVPSTNPELKNVKDEYITVRTDDGGSVTYSWEQIGSTSVDLDNYVQGPQSASNLHVAVFDGTTGKLVADGGATVEELKVTNRAFPVGWRTSGMMAQLISDINSDATAVTGKSYLSTVSYSDLPAGLVQAEMVVEIMDELAGLGKVILFTVTSSDTAPYHWEYTSAYGATGEWRSFVIPEDVVWASGTGLSSAKLKDYEEVEAVTVAFYPPFFLTGNANETTYSWSSPTTYATIQERFPVGAIFGFTTDRFATIVSLTQSTITFDATLSTSDFSSQQLQWRKKRYSSSASGTRATAEGADSAASGDFSHVEGRGTSAANEAEHAEGKYNVNISGVTQHTVGIGTSSVHKNAHAITVDGKHYIPGIGTYQGTETTLPSGQDLATIVNAKAPIASPAFTGTATAPTPSENSNDTQIATTAFVKSADNVFIIKPGTTTWNDVYHAMSVGKLVYYKNALAIYINFDSRDMYVTGGMFAKIGGNGKQIITYTVGFVAMPTVVADDLPETTRTIIFTNATQSADGYMSAADKTKLDAINIKKGTTAYWNAQVGLIPADGDIIIYTDYETITKTSPVSGTQITEDVPGIKVGTGNAYVQDLAFVGEKERDILLSHVQDSDIHVTTQDKERWDNKLNCSEEVINETLIFNRL